MFKLDVKNPIQFRSATVKNQFSDVEVVVGSEEKIFDKEYVSAIVNKNRVVKFLKESVQYK